MKINRQKAIKVLETKLSELKRQHKEECEARSAWQADVNVLGIGLMKSALNGEVTADFTVEADTYCKTVKVIFKGMKIPELPETSFRSWRYYSDVRDLERELTLLRLSDDETVNVSVKSKLGTLLV